MKVTELVIETDMPNKASSRHPDLNGTAMYQAAEQAFEILSKAKRSWGRPASLVQDDELHRHILNYLGM